MGEISLDSRYGWIPAICVGLAILYSGIRRARRASTPSPPSQGGRTAALRRSVAGWLCSVGSVSLFLGVVTAFLARDFAVGVEVGTVGIAASALGNYLWGNTAKAGSRTAGALAGVQMLGVHDTSLVAPYTVGAWVIFAGLGGVLDYATTRLDPAKPEYGLERVRRVAGIVGSLLVIAGGVVMQYEPFYVGEIVVAFGALTNTATTLVKHLRNLHGEDVTTAV